MNEADESAPGGKMWFREEMNANAILESFRGSRPMFELLLPDDGKYYTVTFRAKRTADAIEISFYGVTDYFNEA